MSRASIHANDDLDPLPGDDAVLAAIAELEDESRRGSDVYGFTAQHIAGKLGIQSARRGGRGAVAGSWSGYMAPALRIAPRLRSLARRGLLVQSFDPSERHRWRYSLPRR